MRSATSSAPLMYKTARVRSRADWMAVTTCVSLVVVKAHGAMIRASVPSSLMRPISPRRVSASRAISFREPIPCGQLAPRTGRKSSTAC